MFSSDQVTVHQELRYYFLNYSMKTYLIPPRQLARKDSTGLLLRAIVKVGTAFERFARTPGLEKARARDYSITK